MRRHRVAGTVWVGTVCVGEDVGFGFGFAVVGVGGLSGETGGGVGVGATTVVAGGVVSSVGLAVPPANAKAAANPARRTATSAVDAPSLTLALRVPIRLW